MANPRYRATYTWASNLVVVEKRHGTTWTPHITTTVDGFVWGCGRYDERTHNLPDYIHETVWAQHSRQRATAYGAR